MKARPTIPRQLLLLALGLLALIGGVALARQWLPEWRTGGLPERSVFVERYRELALQAGAHPGRGTPRLSLTRSGKNGSEEQRRFDALGPEAAVAAGGGMLVEVRQRAHLAGRKPQDLVIQFLPSGEPWSLAWGHEQESVRATIAGKNQIPAVRRAELARLLLRGGESLGPEDSGNLGKVTTVYPIVGSQPPQRILIKTLPGEVFSLTRRLGKAPSEEEEGTNLAEVLLIVVPVVLGALVAIVLFFVLLGKRRLDLLSGLWIAGFLFLTSAVGSLYEEPSWVGALSVLGSFFLILCAYVLWSTGESFLRGVSPASTVSLDALRAGRLGPRGGDSLLTGLACGALLAGLRLAAFAGAAWAPSAWPDDPSLVFPLFGVVNPFYTGVVMAAGAAIGLALAYRFLSPRQAPWVAGVAIGLALTFVSIRPAGWEVAVGWVAAAIVVFACRRSGLAALLVAMVCGWLLPVAAFTAIHLSWFPFSFLASTVPPVLVLALGLIGVRRPELAERERLRQPAFIRRQEDERRLRYEMDLLARMQRELLPEKPIVAGWEIAVDSILATEAGGDLYDFVTDADGNLWIAAGDVAGHGYSCAIVQAMTAAALTSTITAAQTPSAVLKEVDRVIRRGGAHRNFTSLALVRLDPRTGEAMLGNAGHPFPLLLAHDGEVEEINLPGLPLGQGPQRKYADFRFAIPPGGALVFCSDGLFEATDPRENQYGYDRPRDLLRALGDRPAAEILAALFADWRSFMRADGPPADDTTVLVLKRL